MPAGSAPGRFAYLVPHRPARDVQPGGMALAGGPLSFRHVDVIRRSGDPAQRRLAVEDHATAREWAAADLDSTQLLRQLENCIAPRAPIAGLSFDRPRVMGIINVTPDSFSDGGRLADAQAAIEHGLRLEAEGAEILDVGGESTRPGSDAVSLEEELARVLPVIEGLAARSGAVVSIDTRKAEVMRQAAAAGARIINDVSALTHDRAAMATAAELGLPVILMHAQGDPKTMQVAPAYDHCLLDVFDWLQARIAACEAAGISRARLIIDPGIGFGKTLDHNLELLSGLALFHGLGTPVLLGASRKSFIGALSGKAPADRRVAGSVAVVLAGLARGVQLFRVHDVAETRQAIAVWDAIEDKVAP